MALPPPAADETALVTGASSGIGRAIASALAARGHGVTLVARRAGELQRLADELGRAHGIRAEMVPTDLSDAAARQAMIAEIERRGLAVQILVNNAGFGIYAPFGTVSLDREREQLELSTAAVIHLSAHYLPAMLERGGGAIINMSSTAGFQALPGNGTYAAAKSFILLHSEALWAELRGTGVTVTAVCPGPVRSGFQEASQPLFADRLPKFVWRTPDRVAADALRAAERGKRTVIPGGFLVRAFFGPNRIVPRGLALFVSRRLFAGELKRGREFAAPMKSDA